MKILKEYAKINGLKVVKINYRAYGQKSTGYDLVKPESREIVLSLEPYGGLSIKWYFRHTHDNYKGKRYFTRATKQMLKDINPLESSFMKLAEGITI